jgi:hypothetical protein
MARLVDIDESGLYLGDVQEDYGWALVGKQAVVESPYPKGRKYNILAALSVNGIVGVWITTDNTNSEVGVPSCVAGFASLTAFWSRFAGLR